MHNAYDSGLNIDFESGLRLVKNVKNVFIEQVILYFVFVSSYLLFVIEQVILYFVLFVIEFF